MDPHRVLSQKVAANLALGAPSEPSTPFPNVVFNRFMLVMSFSCSSELAHGGQNVRPPLRTGKDAMPMILGTDVSRDVNSLQDSVCMEIIGPSSPIILYNFCFGFYKGKEGKEKREREGEREGDIRMGKEGRGH